LQSTEEILLIEGIGDARIILREVVDELIADCNV
jgi:hypothetical protein